MFASWRRDGSARAPSGIVEAAPGPPEVQFDFVVRTRGLDYIDEIRAGMRKVAGERYQ